MTEILNKDDIKKFLPHREPMLLIEEAYMDENGLAHANEIPGNITLYAGIDKVRFKNTVKPGDVCEVTASLDDRRGQLFFCSAKLEVNGKLCCKGMPSFALVPIQQ